MSANPSTHVQALIIGAGPAGIGAAIGLQKNGVQSILMIERRHEIGGIPALYRKKSKGIPTFIVWTRGRMMFGEEYAALLNRRLGKYEIDVKTDCLVISIDPEKKSVTTMDPNDGLRTISAEAVILACGAREMSLAERGWISGARPEKIFFTKHLLDLIDKNDFLPAKKSVIIGSDLVAYAAAAKLRAAGASEASIIDISPRPQCSLPERIYFRRWSKPTYYGSAGTAEIVGSKHPSAVILAAGKRIDCDSIVLSGGLIPNSELALLGKLEVDLPSRRPVTKGKYHLSKPGFFAAGNMLGGFHGAGWCYFSGLQAARQVSKYLSNPATQ